MLSELCFGSTVSVLTSLSSEFWIHRCVLVGLPFNRQLEAATQHPLFLRIAEAAGVVDHQFGVEQTEMGEGVLGFLGRRIPEQLREVVVAEFFGDIGEEQIFAVGHALPAKGGFEIGLGGGFGQIHDE